MALIHIDITQFLRNPVRTGIQRLVRELLANWPSHYDKRVIHLNHTTGRFTNTPRIIVDYLVESSMNPYLQEAGISNIIEGLLANIEIEYANIAAGDVVLCPEIFVDQHRSYLYKMFESNDITVAMIIIDFIPWLDPNSFNIVKAGGLNWYIESVCLASKRCFISTKVKRDFETRVMRRVVDVDPVIPLGADGFGEESIEATAVDRNLSVLCFGSLDGRKGQGLVFEAFLQSVAADKLKLVFAGRVPVDPGPSLQGLLSYKGDNVEIVSNPDDRTLARMIAQARGTVYASRQEGFGLPAVESLWFGTPLIVDADLPAIEGLPGLGQIRLYPADLGNLTRGFDRLADNSEATRLTLEASRLQLMSWKSYAADVARWACS